LKNNEIHNKTIQSNLNSFPFEYLKSSDLEKLFKENLCWRTDDGHFAITKAQLAINQETREKLVPMITCTMYFCYVFISSYVCIRSVGEEGEGTGYW